MEDVNDENKANPFRMKTHLQMIGIRHRFEWHNNSQKETEQMMNLQPLLIILIDKTIFSNKWLVMVQGFRLWFIHLIHIILLSPIYFFVAMHLIV